MLLVLLVLLHLLLLLHCCRLLNIVKRAASRAELESNLVGDLVTIGIVLLHACSEVVLAHRSRADLLWGQTGEICVDCGMSHLKRGHGDIVSVLLIAKLQGLLQDIFIADHAHIWVIVLNSLVVNDLLSLVDGHLLDDISQELHSLIWR